MFAPAAQFSSQGFISDLCLETSSDMSSRTGASLISLILTET